MLATLSPMRRVVELVDRFVSDGQLIAGPDCPEVYFLTGRFSPSGALFDFFSGDVSGGNGLHASGRLVSRERHSAESWRELLSSALGSRRCGASKAVPQLEVGRPVRSEVALMRVRDRLLEHPAVYSAWQAPFAAEKFAPVERGFAIGEIRRVLDVGCGTGTNAARFDGIDYVGLDINERYLADRARQIPRPLHDCRSDDGRLLIARHVRHDPREQLSSSCPDADVERILAQLARLLSRPRAVCTFSSSCSRSARRSPG